MKRWGNVKWLAGLFITVSSCFGSTIISATNSPGNISFYLAANFVEVEKGADVAGAIVTATFNDGSSASCVFASSGSCADAGSNFAVNLIPSNANTLSADWLVSDLRAVGTPNDMATLTIDLRSGNSAFSPCVVGGNPDVNDSCGNAKSATTTSSGSPASATVFYTNEVAQSGTTPDGSWWGTITLTFSGAFRNGTANNSNGQFDFKIDSDFVGALSAAGPEPGTWGSGLMAMVVLASGVVYRRRRSQKQ
jgi:MYXO-CTERM domain-containing protein